MAISIAQVIGDSSENVELREKEQPNLQYHFYLKRTFLVITAFYYLQKSI